MSFFVKRDNSVLIILLLGLLVWGVHHLAHKSSMEKIEREERLALQQKEREEIRERAEIRRAEKEAARLAEIEAKEAREVARLAAIQKEKAAEAQRLVEERQKLAEEKRLAAIAQQKREDAWSAFKGTKYDELKVDLNVYQNVTVTAADAYGISIIHEHGGRKIAYENLSEEIQKSCLYDPVYAEAMKQQELENQKKLRDSTKKLKKALASSPTKERAREVKPAAKPRGYVKCRVVKHYSSYSSAYGRTVQYKKIEVEAMSSVPARLYVNGSPSLQVSPKVKQFITITSKAHGRYSVVLKTHSGQVLDSESRTRTGLSSSSLR